MFDIAEKIAISNLAFNYYIDNVQSEKDKIIVKTHLGILDDGQIIEGEYNYTKNSIKYRIRELCINELPIDGLYKMVTMVEGIFVIVINKLLQEYPEKIGSKIKIDATIILESQSLDELKNYLFKRVINDLTYKSPEDFAKDFKDISGVDLLKCESYSYYIELKATRDLFMHNDGIINEIYLRKVKDFKRGDDGEKIVCDYDYFLNCYEHCHKVVEFLIEELNLIWKSSDYIDWKNGIVNKVKNENNK
ncbi:MAG: hypothetical protein EOO19_06105 [Chryseobacterium sp.]|nr:MAG: hypothetical protein EOO19_06105 [Chryseobacterium sp.]